MPQRESPEDTSGSDEAPSPCSAALASRRSKITPEREQEFYDAVLERVRESGYESLTMEGIALQTRCSKSTLYRQWKNKTQFVAAALRAKSRVRFIGIDTGTLAGDLLAAGRAAGERSGADTLLVHALTHAALHDEELKRVLLETLVEPEIAAIDAMLRRGAERGEIPADHPAAPFVAAQILGVLRVRPVLEGRYADGAYLTRFVETSVLPALGLVPPAS
ncbi:TetR/AcrR family transcriptional regulator [Streptomyces tsukubensis]|uniref:TetR family transcriptional regulator n=1 Tax=Streptomyces tsukubensis TaxID=83656 RepID=A0A1V4ADG3_9ACTN|nr:TetR/AcrR family transcriptional regulator [Streptomyces tsukubensis]OON81800.1 TetR family transcriptional regulator [Streptomyces tsukubensis]QFR96589.1 TetR family transcriptional regulator [Streptomyces tsukubensis]